MSHQPKNSTVLNTFQQTPGDIDGRSADSTGPSLDSQSYIGAELDMDFFKNVWEKGTRGLEGGASIFRSDPKPPTAAAASARQQDSFSVAVPSDSFVEEDVSQLVDDLNGSCDEDFYVPRSTGSSSLPTPHSRPIKRRRRLTSQESRFLQEAFRKNPKPTSEARSKIAQALGMPIRAIQIWFQNRRAKSRRDSGDATPAVIGVTPISMTAGAASGAATFQSPQSAVPVNPWSFRMEYQHQPSLHPEKTSRHPSVTAAGLTPQTASARSECEFIPPIEALQGIAQCLVDTSETSMSKVFEQFINVPSSGDWTEFSHSQTQPSTSSFEEIELEEIVSPESLLSLDCVFDVPELKASFEPGGNSTLLIVETP